MKLGFIGLGRMGGSMVARLTKGGHEVLVAGRNPQHVAAAAAETGATATKSYEDLIQRLGAYPVVWIMIPSDAVDSELAKLMDLLPKGGVIVDGGNSNYRLTQGRAKTAAALGLTYLDAGTSGGILGDEAGYCIMVGGDEPTARRLAPVFEALVAPNGWGYFGPSGAGHFVKMVHNAIEYGLMEAYAEGFRMLKDDTEYPNLDLATVAEVWQHGSIIDSKLNELNAQIFKDNPELTGIDGYVADTGEGRWTLERAAAAGIPMPAIQASLDVRRASQAGESNFGTKLLAAERAAFGGHALNKPADKK